MSDKIQEIKKSVAKLYFINGWIPDYTMVINWYNKTTEYKNKGFGIEDAGIKAAKEIFGKYFQDNTLVIKRYVQAATEQFSNIRKSHEQVQMILHDYYNLIKK
jgi:hypothetical protein